MRRVVLVSVSVLVLVLVGCGGGTATTSPDDGNGGGGATSTPEPQATQDGSGGGGGGGSVGDLEGLAAALVPPNSTEVFKTTAEGAVIAGYESTDSLDTVKGFYENAIAGTGLAMLATTEAGGGVSWIFGADDANSGFGGAVTIAPSGSGSGTTVSITLGDGS
jgi:hypothetical protein